MIEQATPQEIARSLTVKAERRLKAQSDFKEAIRWTRQHPEEFATKIEEFNSVCNMLNELMQQDIISLNHFFPNVAHVRSMMQIGRRRTRAIDTPFTLEEMHSFYHGYQKRKDYQPDITNIRSAWLALKEKLTSSDFQIPEAVRQDPQKLASVLLLEGFGLAVERFHVRPEIAAGYVLAFGEVLTMRHRNSQLFWDLKEYMISRKDMLSPRVARILEQE